MADKEDKNLIGFDPLAWMNDESTATGEQKIEIEAEVVVEDEQEPQAASDAIEDVNDVAIELVKTDTTKELGIQQIEDNTDDSVITLDATLNIQNVANLYDRLVKQLETQHQIEIDASAVVSIDTATLQLLIVLKQTAIKLHKEVIIDFPSDKFIEAAELLGLSEMLEVDQAAAGFF